LVMCAARCRTNSRYGCLIISHMCKSKIGILALLGMFVAGVCALIGRRREPPVSMHELDWRGGEGNLAVRRYNSPGHFFHHLKELAGLSVPLLRVYVLQALSPSFREQVMIVTAMADACPQ